MTRAELMEQLEKMVEVKPGALHDHAELADLPGWDSLTQVQFVMVVERARGIRPSATRLAECRTVQDLLHLFDGLPSAK